MLYDKGVGVAWSATKNSRLGLPVPQTNGLFRALHFGFMKSPDERSGNIAVVPVIVVARPIEIVCL
jgi:hypothetical protein